VICGAGVAVPGGAGSSTLATCSPSAATMGLSERGWVSVCPLGWTKCECPMRPMPVVMARIDPKHVFELAAAEDEQPVEALATHAADPALGVGVRVRCPDRGADHGDPFALEDVIEAAAELGVAIKRLPAQNRQLMSQQEDLEFLRPLRFAQQHDQLNQPAERQVDERPDHANPKDATSTLSGRSTSWFFGVVHVGRGHSARPANRDDPAV
jgi:hypothetical protein